MKETGILLALSSLPAPCGVGDLGEAAFRWVDLLAENGVTVWQLLPLNPLGYGNSPYLPDSSFAGDEVYISLEALAAEGLLEQAPEPLSLAPGKAHYAAVRRWKEPWLRRAWHSYRPEEDFRRFCAQPWVQNYGVFCALKKENGGRSWTDWPAEQRDWPSNHALDLTPLEDEIQYRMFLQHRFARQWGRLRDYARARGVRLMGDLPFYVGADSADVWANRSQFLLRQDGRPAFVAGVPPDSFSSTGQRWGSPLYDWTEMEAQGFSFWVSRVGYAGALFDLIRLDHFLGMDCYWQIPAACPTAVEGSWQKAPGERLLETLHREVPGLRLVAGDLGVQTPGMQALKDRFGLMGMKIFQYDLYLDKKRPVLWPDPAARQIFYTGTHDNATLREWYLSRTIPQRRKLRKWLKRQGRSQGSPCQGIIRTMLESPCELVIFPLADLMELGGEARMNLPGTVGSPNWEWRLTAFPPAAAALRRFRPQIMKRKEESPC